MALQTTKTTIEIDTQLLYQAKLKALQSGQTLKQYIEDGIKLKNKTKPTLDSERAKALKKLAKETLGSLKNTKNSNWKDLESIMKWQNDIRAEWDR